MREKFIFIGLLSLALLMGCGEEKPMGPAPLGAKPVLEKLAEAYRQESEKLPVTPTGLTPAGRRKFLETVFRKAGYDYSKTLLALSKTDKSSITQLHRDLQQLLFLPHYDGRVDDLSELYNPQELDAIERIKKTFK